MTPPVMHCSRRETHAQHVWRSRKEGQRYTCPGRTMTPDRVTRRRQKRRHGLALMAWSIVGDR